MKSVMITGVTGQDGSYLAEIALQAGYEVIGLKRWTATDNTRNIKHLEGKEGFQTLYWDAHDASSVINPILTYRPNIIFNMAAPSFVGQSFSNPDSEIAALTKPLIHICETVKTHHIGSRIYQAGSSEMFGSQSHVLDLGSRKNPLSPYGVGKLTAYSLCRYYWKLGVNVTCGVLFNHESPRRGDNFLTQKVVRGLVALALKKRMEPVEIWDKRPLRDWGDAREYMGIVFDEMTKVGYEPTDFMLATGESHRVEDFCWSTVDYIQEFYRYRLPDPCWVVNNKNARPTDIPIMMGRTTLDVTPKLGMREVIKKMVDAEMSRVGGI